MPVLTEFYNTIGISFAMGGLAFVFSTAIAVPLGIFAATHQYSKGDYIISAVALAGISLPTFFFATLLKLVFSVGLAGLTSTASWAATSPQLDAVRAGARHGQPTW